MLVSFCMFQNQVSPMSLIIGNHTHECGTRVCVYVCVHIDIDTQTNKQSKGFQVSCCSLTKLCPTLCHPMNCSTPGSLVLYCLPEFAQIHVH